MEIITIDFETYYDKSYTLNNHSAEEYINDPRFEVIGVGIKRGRDAATWHSETAYEALGGIDFTNAAVLCHNTLFDGAILAWKLNIKPKFWLDTFSMCRYYHGIAAGGSLKYLAKHYKLGEKGVEVAAMEGRGLSTISDDELKRYGAYCKNDVELTYALFHRLVKEGFTTKQLMLIDVLIRMFTEPRLVVDQVNLQKVLDTRQREIQEVLGFLSGHGFNIVTATSMLRSDEKFAQMLAYKGVDPPMKTSITTGKRAYAFAKTDLPFLDLLNNEDETIRKLAKARLSVKSTILESRSEKLLGISKRNKGKLPVVLNYMGAHTGRLSGGGGVNLQNIPHEGDIRKALIAPDGHKIIVGDSSQIEARLLAYVAGQNDLVEAFREQRDVYCEFAADIYGRPITKEDYTERFVGKQGVLSLGYGSGSAKFRHTLALGNNGPAVNIEEDEAETIVRLYRQRNHKIVSLWNSSGDALRTMMNGGKGCIADPLLPFTADGIELPHDFVIHYPELKPGSNGYEYRKTLRGGATSSVKIYGSKVVENIIQSIAGAIIADQMVQISTKFFVALNVHDEIVIVCKDEEVENAKQFFTSVMSNPPDWAPNLPLACEVGVGQSYGEAK